ncbi:MAG: hypothetical protein EWV50_04320 [Microcystis aeruginosa Ma_MB_F_20061100_S20]|uniref:Uncharacterized protein n=1 Tax=Microcystis aeruginosa Ma_MB_F_20061100_S20D TaxID=2486253 RepID=A0A552EB62_MICAE|nr:MAG: hypothetical protein EWV78_20150 [Microcystis aeruginosa Ma_MB_F_20061100_S20D]TRU42053.1 MAG: hypothetical protein EWV50_04320 [Microcystis aeruginosa Ma_MB_F_20061100_S20]
MNEQNSILPEITGLAAGIIIGAMIMVIGRMLFGNGIIPTYTSNWIQSNYMPAVLVVGAFSSVFAVIWYLISLKWWRTFTEKEFSQARISWWLLFVLPFLSFIISLFIWGKDGNNNLETIALVFFSLILLLGMCSSYWLSTALSTPPNMRRVVPLVGLFPRSR